MSELLGLIPIWLLWLLPIPLATSAAVAWTAWTGRERGPEQTAASVRDYERYRRALAPDEQPPRP